jgi:hypothetical protein
MLDDFREQAGAFNDLEPETEPVSTEPRLHRSRIFGMTPLQTFVVALLLFMLSCLLSVFCLLVTGRVVPPFLY